MIARHRLVQPTEPEVIDFPEKPTLKDLISSDTVKPTFSFRKKEETPEPASPLFYFQPKPKEQENQPTEPLSEETEKHEPEASPTSHFDSTDPIEQGLEHIKSSVEPAHEQTEKASAQNPTTPTPAYRHFIRLNEIRQPPKVNRHKAQIACLMAITSCVYIGLACCVAIITLLIT